MTYRDDHDASIARAAALENDLQRAEADRKRAVAERDELAAQLAKVRSEHTPVVTEIVVAERAPLTAAEVDALVGDLETRAIGARLGAMAGLGMALVFGVLVGITSSLGLGRGSLWTRIAFAVFAVVGTAYGVVIRRRDRWQPVLDALRDAPTRIVRVSHRQSTGRYRGRHYLTIATASAKLVIKEPDWTWLYDRLQRRCPSATFEL